MIEADSWFCALSTSNFAGVSLLLVRFTCAQFIRAFAAKIGSVTALTPAGVAAPWVPQYFT